MFLVNRPSNNGLQRICALARRWVFTNHTFGPPGLVHSLAQTAETKRYASR